MSSANDKWYAVSVTVPPEYIEAAEFAFGGVDSLGTVTDLMPATPGAACTVTTYFLIPPADEKIHEEMKTATQMYGLPLIADLEIRRSIVEQQDWLAEWKKYWSPTRAGRFLIAAPWHEHIDDDSVVVRIEPNMAFGTGTHETTRLCLEAIDRHYRPEFSFLDVGTGTGILAISAAKLADPEAEFVAVDNDPDAVEIARVNASMNGVGDRINFGVGTLSDISGSFDLVCANLTADVIVPILSELLERTRVTLVLSGILVEQQSLVTDQIPQERKFDVVRSGEWIAIEIGR